MNMTTSDSASVAGAADKGLEPDRIFGSGFETPPPDGPPLAVRVLNKAAYGPRPGDIAAFNALGANDTARLTAWVNRQLDPDAIVDTACDNRISAAPYSTASMTVPQLWATHVRGSTAAGGPAAWPRRYYPAEEAHHIKLVRALYSERQLYEVMVDFWHNHFNVQGWDFGISPVFMHYDRDVMRGRHPTTQKRYALGNFRALLEEVGKSPAMLMYLDNKSSRGTGFNENYARELCELHTLGAQNYYGTADAGSIPRYPDGLPRGYSDFYVYEAARCFTGWTMRDAHWEFPATPEYDTGEFLYFPAWHDRASKNFLARSFGDVINPDGPAMGDGRSVYDRLASHPGTAQHICGKLVRRFVSDTPPQRLVDEAALEFQLKWQDPDQIALVLAIILKSPEFRAAWGEKTKRPWEAMMHAMRATSTVITPQVRPVSGWNSHVELTDRIAQTGNGPFRWPTPDGYPDHSRKWRSVSPLSQTWRTISRLIEMREPSGSDPAFFLRIEQETKTGIAANARSATSIVDFWIARIFGYEIAATRRTQLIDFLRQSASATATLNLDEDDLESGVPQHRGVWNGGNRGRHYSIARLRAMVALMLMCPEFYNR
jgi:uncharacterized protein (DUF1800 family)